LSNHHPLLPHPSISNVPHLTALLEREGVCQRDCTSFFGFLREEGPRIKALLHNFLTTEVCPKFPDPDCVADVYIDRKSRVWLLDVNPFSPVTDTLLFQWGEGPLEKPSPFASLTYVEGCTHSEIKDKHSDHPCDGFRARSVADRVSCCSCVKSSADEGIKLGSDICEGYILADSGDVGDFELRLVPSDLHTVSDPMGCYRGPADMGMGVLGGGAGEEGIDFDELMLQQRNSEEC
ncbi:unnamed protein product, partial [Choristocarpus tenellus]